MIFVSSSTRNAPVKAVFLNVKDEPFRWDNSIEIVIVLEGSIHAAIADEKRILTSGAIEIFNINQVHRLWQTNESNVILQVNIDAGFAEQYLPELQRIWYAHEFSSGSYLGLETTREIIRAICTRIVPILTQNEVPILTYKKIAEQLLDILLINFDFRRSYQGNSTKLQRIEKIYDYLFQNRGFIHKVSLHDIAINTEEYLNLDYLSSQFKMLVGDTLQNLLHYLRIEHSIKQLLKTDLSLVDISIESGFSSPRYFYQQFKKIFPEGPKEFRKQHKTKQGVKEKNRESLNSTEVIQRHCALFGRSEMIAIEEIRRISFDLFGSNDINTSCSFIMEISKLLEGESQKYMESILQMNKLNPSKIFKFEDTFNLMNRDMEVISFIMNKFREKNILPVFIVSTSQQEISEQIPALQQLFQTYSLTYGAEQLKGWRIEIGSHSE